MKKVRIPSLLLALSIVLTALALPASAAGTAPTLSITNSDTSAQTLSLRSLPADCYGIQLTLELDRKLDHTAFVFADSLPMAGAYYTCQEGVLGGWNITLYLTAKAAFSQGELVLGTLFSNEAFQIVSVSYLELLLGSGSNVESVSYETVALEKKAQSSSNGSSSSSGSGDSGLTWYSISVPKPDNGSVTLSSATAVAGSTVTVTVQPNEGYQLQELTMTSRSGAKIAITDKGGGVFTFVMPSGTVELQASFVLVPAESQEPLPESPEPVDLPFTDVQPGDWFYDAVEYVYARGLMTGTSAVEFSPNLITSRGMIVTLLYRLEGEPDTGSLSFDDVEPDQWYTNAVSWCAEKGLVNGYGDGRFGPNDAITREQMAAILYRYAGYKGYDVTAQADLSGFADVDRVSSYALESMQWASAEKLIQGVASETGTTLSPSDSAVRSQIATILMRFCENIAENQNG